MVWPLTSRSSWDARSAWDTCITWKPEWGRQTIVMGVTACCILGRVKQLSYMGSENQLPSPCNDSWISSLLGKSRRKRPQQLSWAFCDLSRCLVLRAILLPRSCSAWKGRGRHSCSSQRTRLLHPLLSTTLGCVRPPAKKERRFLTSPLGPGGPGRPGTPGGPCMVTLSPANCRRRVRDSQE